ncbi:FtsX-like permease family protein [Arachnia propionica]|uniref:FtsX-like permease family protein n=1 Tax=Arachnia propionica TaxID=1750 RepID=A0A3P1WVN0_9ACTN|nr:FtsX-like permease family protein [Arachnia propionica]RRD50291.1 FtsX-like permease family protein [Arachnia propionica]
MSGVTGLAPLTLQLTRGRFASRQGETLLYFVSILASAISATLALTVIGGTVMLYGRWQSPPAPLAEAIAAEPAIESVVMVYFVLGVLATALLVPAMVSLSASAAVLGARGREQRLSALRLLGLSSGDVTRMSLLDSLIQAAIGTLLGAVIHLVTVPLWAGIELEGVALTRTDLYLPWWAALIVCGANIGIALLSSWWGLRQVRISPLGVARQAPKPRVTWFRAVVFVVILAGHFWVLQSVKLGRDIWGYLVMAGVGLMLVVAINVVGPWLLQWFAKGFARLPGAAPLMAARRIQADPRATWRQVGGLGFLAFISGFIATMPIEVNIDGSVQGMSFAEATRWDLTKGVIVMLAAGLILAATAVLISQASAVFERGELTRSLRRLGTPDSFHTKVMWWQNLAPLVLILGQGYVLGAGMAWPMLQVAARLGLTPQLAGTYVVIGVLLGGFLLTALGLIAVQPLQRQVLATQRRRND